MLVPGTRQNNNLVTRISYVHPKLNSSRPTTVPTLLLIPIGALVGGVAGLVIGAAIGRNTGETNRETCSAMRTGLAGGALGGILGAAIDLLTGGGVLLFVLALAGALLGSALGTTGIGIKRIPWQWFSGRHRPY